MKTSFKIAFLFALLFTLHNCQKDDEIQTELQQESVIKHITINDFNSRVNQDASFEALSNYLDINRATLPNNTLGRTVDTNLVLTNNIIAIDNDLGTSYTFKLERHEEGNEFYNLIVNVDTNGTILETRIYEYIPSQGWMTDTSQPFSGQLQIHENDLFSDSEISNLYSRGREECYEATWHWECNAGNDHAPNTCTAGGSDLIVDVQVVNCGDGGSSGGGGAPSFPIGTNPPNTGGGTILNNPPDGTGGESPIETMTTPLNPEECTPSDPRDLNGDCSVDEIEECVAGGSSYDKCYFELYPEEWLVYEEAPGDIIDLVEYLDCFDNAPTTATFKFTVYVDQPIPNQDDTWTNDGTILNPDINVGHTFISLEMNDAGTITSQAIGFYPSSGVNPTDPQVAGAWIDDGNHDYDVSASINLDHTQFTNLINDIETFGTPTYNLNSLNCTDAAIQLGNSAGMNLPDTNGSWIGGGGSNPGNLGQDVRGLNNNNLTINTAGGTASLSAGPCN